MVSGKQNAMADHWQNQSILIAGCGSIGKRHARVLRSLGVQDICACDPDERVLASLIEATPGIRPARSFEEGLRERPDAVFVLTPPRLHIPMSMQALEAGCHVFCEKPLSDTLDGVAELEEHVTRSGRQMMVGLCFRYHAGLRRIKELLDTGTIGRLVSIRALMGEHLPSVRPDYRTLFTSQYSGAFDLTHEVDLAVWFAEQPVTRVQAVYGGFSDIGIAAPDTVEMLISFQDRCVATVHLDFFQRPRRRQLELIGTEGVVTIEFASWDACTIDIYRAETATSEQIRMATQRDDMFADEDRDFLTAIASNSPVRCTIAEGRRSLEVVVAAQEHG